MKKVIVIGANSKATEGQCRSSFNIGYALASKKYYVIHGGGTGTMRHTTLGMQNFNKEIGDRLNHIIWPNSMQKESDETIAVYDNIFKKEYVPTIHERIGRLIEESKTCNYLICYSGGLGSINEIYAILVAYYDRTSELCPVLICNTDASEFIDNMMRMLYSFDIPTRPYMRKMIDKIKILSESELIAML